MKNRRRGKRFTRSPTLSNRTVLIMEGITSRVCFLRGIQPKPTDSDTFYVNRKATRVDLCRGSYYATFVSRETLICIFPLLRRYSLTPFLTILPARYRMLVSFLFLGFSYHHPGLADCPFLVEIFLSYCNIYIPYI